ncbi:hypothetical protein KQ940_22365 [Marinobacterium sp. D7]|uniref:hypothetical protein n=1 Tax=Marinobacterium ramblicola TaxID=2849041 RepID=UPI001C2CFB27|nr:hypothetical protein [Marinobacterium ramblicola]MBV1790816.1 hypothetical protein [Marinobacterium ramblicola]
MVDKEQQERLIRELEKSLEADLLSRHGPVMTGEALYTALGYVSKAAFSQSLVRKTVPVPVFELEHRRGKFALVKDIAHYLAERRYKDIVGDQSKSDQ